MDLIAVGSWGVFSGPNVVLKPGTVYIETTILLPTAVEVQWWGGVRADYFSVYRNDVVIPGAESLTAVDEWVDGNLQPNTIYQYFVRATNIVGYTDSEIRAITTYPHGSGGVVQPPGGSSGIAAVVGGRGGAYPKYTVENTVDFVAPMQRTTRTGLGLGEGVHGDHVDYQ